MTHVHGPRKRQRQALVEATVVQQGFAEACQRFEDDIVKRGGLLDEVALKNGVGAAADLARQFVTQFHVFKNNIHTQLGRPAPWPARVSCRSRIGPAPIEANCNRAAILRACSGSTRLSDAAVVISIAGSAVPSLTF